MNLLGDMFDALLQVQNEEASSGGSTPVRVVRVVTVVSVVRIVRDRHVVCVVEQDSQFGVHLLPRY